VWSNPSSLADPLVSVQTPSIRSQGAAARASKTDRANWKNKKELEEIDRSWLREVRTEKPDFFFGSELVRASFLEQKKRRKGQNCIDAAST
jgi:hypothetical protein